MFAAVQYLIQRSELETFGCFSRKNKLGYLRAKSMCPTGRSRATVPPTIGTVPGPHNMHPDALPTGMVTGKTEDPALKMSKISNTTTMTKGTALN